MSGWFEFFLLISLPDNRKPENRGMDNRTSTVVISNKENEGFRKLLDTFLKRVLNDEAGWLLLRDFITWEVI